MNAKDIEQAIKHTKDIETRLKETRKQLEKAASELQQHIDCFEKAQLN